jgi:hypothetical protein
VRVPLDQAREECGSRQRDFPRSSRKVDLFPRPGLNDPVATYEDRPTVVDLDAAEYAIRTKEQVALGGGRRGDAGNGQHRGQYGRREVSGHGFRRGCENGS